MNNCVTRAENGRLIIELNCEFSTLVVVEVLQSASQFVRRKRRVNLQEGRSPKARLASSGLLADMAVKVEGILCFVLFIVFIFCCRVKLYCCLV